MARIDDIQSARQPHAAPTLRRPTLALVGLSHRTAPLEELERVALDSDGARNAVRRLLEDTAVLETAVLATCNRTEIYMVARDHEAAVEHAQALLHDSGMPDSAGVYVKFGHDVAAHLFRVAAGIDSLMIGEVQVLGQVKQAFALAQEEDAARATLGKLFGRAFRVGKRSRTETAIGEGAVSVSYAALGLARKIYSDLRDRSILVIGAGETGTLTARHFAEAGIGELLVLNRTPERAAALATEVGGVARPWSELGALLADVDVAVSATSSPIAIIDRDMVEAALRKRGNRRLVLIDIALPRDVDPRVNDLEGVFLHDMAALDVIVQRNLERRRREIPQVEAIVAEEVHHFETWQGSLEAGPTIRDLREHFDRVRRSELTDLARQLDEETMKRVDRATRAMVNRLLHEPQVTIRRPRPGAGSTQRLAAIVRELFGLDDDDVNGDDAQGDSRSRGKRRGGGASGTREKRPARARRDPRQQPQTGSRPDRRPAHAKPSDGTTGSGTTGSGTTGDGATGGRTPHGGMQRGDDDARRRADDDRDEPAS